MGWIYLAQATVQRQAAVSTIMNFQIPYKAEEFLNQPTDLLSSQEGLSFMHLINYHEVYLKCIVYPE
jgi:hypothetical protein